ncbi:hypothetical protein JQ612_24620 [Bradyrhizobium manausense]|uniref:hypothetical protein n=1 Tax=Bradyrhizobium manausense TaxID=989370 RepID=UPI001BA4FAAE|nr:hypothetical protein [Bradyrhizobium manausense]MBR0836385.1 hypothetical protein [Bradyrhizobium manausense]
MDVHPIFDVIASWPGRIPTQRAFAARGFLIPAAWQNRMIEFCGGHQADVLNRYWDEVALETMRCAGKLRSEMRYFGIEPKYRSTFLDELFAARDFVEPPFQAPPLIRCLFEHMKKTWFDAGFGNVESAFIKTQQKQESERLGIQTAGWTGKKKGVIPFVDHFCTALGFERRRNHWRKKLDCGLIFEVSLDLGGNPNRIGSPLMFRIFHADDPKFAFEMGGNEPFDQLVYGSRLYGGAGDARDHVLGIRAYIELFDVIAASFGASQQA